MALHVVVISIPAATPTTAPFTYQFEVGEAFIRKITADNEAGGNIHFRVSHNGLTFAPWPGPGLDPWITMVNMQVIAWEEFRQLSGPPYTLTVEATNVHATLAKQLILLIETAHANFYPVNILDVKENAVPKIPQAQTPNAAY